MINFYSAMSDDQKKRFAAIQKTFGLLMDCVDENLKDGLDKASAVSRIEEACFWSLTGIMREK